MTVLVPLKDSLPLQLPVAVQAVALAEDQVSVADCPSVMDLGLTDRVGALGTAAVTFSVTELVADCPAGVVQESI